MTSKTKPYVSSYPQLQAWLVRHEAVCLWETYRDRNGTAMVSCFRVGRGRVIVVTYAEQAGYDLYSAINASEAGVLADAAVRCGV